MQTPTPTGCPARAATPSEPIVVLRPVGQVKATYSELCGAYLLHISSDTYTHRIYKPNPSDMARGHHPAQWFGWETRRASDGNQWSGPPQRFVMDDFGYLVPVEATA